MSGVQHRRYPWRAVAVAVTAVVAGGAAAVAKWPHAWWWLVVLTASAAALATPTVSAIIGAAEKRAEVTRKIRAALQDTTGGTGGELPTVANANLQARVHRAVLPIPYISRDEEGQVRRLLREGRPVLLVGSSMVGKTRMAAKVIGDMFSSRPVVIPDTKKALAELDGADILINKAVVWLDDIDRLIGVDGITDGAVRRLAAANIVIATIRAGEYDRYRPTDQIRPVEWNVLSVFEPVFISRELSDSEQQRLTEVVEDPEVLDRIRDVGIGEYSGAAVHIAEMIRLGAAGAGGLGYSIVRGVADWRQSGITRPVPSSLLTALAEPHTDARNKYRLSDQQAIESGLAWATRDINPTVSLLQRVHLFSGYDFSLMSG